MQYEYYKVSNNGVVTFYITLVMTKQKKEKLNHHVATHFRKSLPAIDLPNNANKYSLSQHSTEQDLLTSLIDSNSSFRL